MICVAGGGTGGHLAIARALGVELKRCGIPVIFIGSTNGQDKMWFENCDIFAHKYFLPSSGVVNKKGIKKIFSLLNIIKLSFSCFKIFAKHDIKAVISVGGYSSAAPSFAAVMSAKALFLHEQNAVVGRLNGLLKPFCKGFFSSYDKNERYDYPVNDEFFRLYRVRNELKCVMFLGGSQGAKKINEIALDLAPILDKKGIKIIHQCGKNSLDEVRAKYDEMGISADVFDFRADIAETMSKADVCVSRAGASSLWELCANGLPSVFIPYPYAAGNHQYFNALFLSDKNLAKVINEKDANSNLVLEAIKNMDLASVSTGLKELNSSYASAKIIDKIIKILSE